jgi:FkbM family methyltransferase
VRRHDDRNVHRGDITATVQAVPHGSLIEIAKRSAYAVLDARHGFRGVPRLVNDEEVRFPARWSRYYPEVYEPEKVAFLRAGLGPGDVAIDLGAHIGLFTVHMAHCVGATGRVIAFEPAPETRAVLQQTVGFNGLVGVVTVRDEAVTNQIGTVEFHETGDRCSNANSVIHTGRTATTRVVRTTTLDAAIADAGGRVALVKIDIEGAELEVLETSVDILTSQRPRITLEVHPVELAEMGRDPREVFDVLESAGYRVSAAGHPLGRADFQSEGCFEVQAEAG